MAKPSLSDKFKKQLLDDSKSLELTRSITLTKTQCDLVIKFIMEEFELEEENMAFAILAITAQQGGTARGCSGNYQFKYRNKTYKLALIRLAFKNAIGDRYALRKFARTHATFFHEICQSSGNLQGNLTNKIKDLSDVQLLNEEKVWLSDFQADNDDCPEKLRKLIKSSFKLKRKK